MGVTLPARFRFTPATGFPHVDFSPLEWNDTVQRLSALHFDGAPELSWGFDGMDGPFRFQRNGVVERAMEVREVRDGTVAVVASAPAGF